MSCTNPPFFFFMRERLHMAYSKVIWSQNESLGLEVHLYVGGTHFIYFHNSDPIERTIKFPGMQILQQFIHTNAHVFLYTHHNYLYNNKTKLHSHMLFLCSFASFWSLLFCLSFFFSFTYTRTHTHICICMHLPYTHLWMHACREEDKMNIHSSHSLLSCGTLSIFYVS